MKRIDVVNGPNLNLLGTREPEIYGSETLEQLNGYIKQRAEEYGLSPQFFQSNSEGALIDYIQEASRTSAGVLINAAAYSHTSIALRDTVAAIPVPCIEVHLSDLKQREQFRHHSWLRDVCVDQIAGFGRDSYVYGMEALVGEFARRDIAQAISPKQSQEERDSATVEILHAAFPKYDWTGIYLVEGAELVVSSYLGAETPHKRIKIGEGICGAAVAEAQSIIVPDVHADPRYLACSIETRSEIVVPIYAGSTIIGEIDIDSHRPDAFHGHDERYLQRIARLLGDAVQGE